MQHMRPDPPSASWMPPEELGVDRFKFGPGKIVLGRAKGRTIALDDNRHVVTVAGSRAGKSVTSLMTNLLTWDGSAIVIDPKGELATNTAKWRAKLGQDVYVLDPFGEVTGDAAQYRASFNPFDELRVSRPDDVIDNAAMIAEALILQGERGPDHWTMSAKNLVRGLCLYALHVKPQDASLSDVREILTSPLHEPENGLGGSKIALERYFENMLAAEDAFDGVVSGVGGTMLGKPEDERGSIISTAIEQTAFLDSPPMRRHVAARGLPSLRVLKHKHTTIFLVLPASKMATHFRWLRLVITQAMAALEGEKNKTGRDVLFVLEEFPVLGYMRQIEAAAGLMAGYNVKLWTVMQDLSQIKALYPKSWETFLGNAGIVEAFGNTDSVTLDYLSKRLGMTWATQRQPENLTLEARASGQPHEREQVISVPLMASYEIAQAFARDHGNKLVMVAGEKPFALKRIFWKDMIRGVRS